MSDLPVSLAQLIAACADNDTGAIVEGTMRSFAVTVVPTGATMLAGASLTMSTVTLVVAKTVGSPTTITLPTPLIPWVQTYTIKDGKKDCATNNITLVPQSGTIDGQSSFVMNVNGDSIDLRFDGTNWWLV